MEGEQKDGTLEGIRISTETISAADFLKEIEVDGEIEPRFRQGGDFVYSPFTDGSHIRDNTGWFSLIRVNGYIVGIAQLIRDPNDLKKVAIRNMCIMNDLKGLRKGSEEEREMRLSETLLRAVFRFVLSTKAAFYLTRYTGEGAERLKHRVEAIGREEEFKDVRIVSAPEFGVFGRSDT